MELDKENPFTGSWRINSVQPGDDGTFDRLPMACKDVLRIDVAVSGLVTFRRICTDGKPDPAWEAVRGVYNTTTGEIVGQVLKNQDGKLKTEFLIKALDDNQIYGRHRYNPGGGGWTGDPD